MADSKEPIPALVPLPTSVELRSKPGNNVNPGQLKLTTRSHIVVSKELEPLAKVLSDEIFLLSGVRLATEVVGDALRTKTRDGDLKLFILDGWVGAAKSSEAYRILVDRSALLAGKNYQGVAAGTVTLLQSLRYANGSLSLPHMWVDDAPAYPYRGALIDLARKYHTIGGIEQVIELCRLYKIRYLQLHLTDDQLFMFPSQRFPQVGRSNSEFARFEPGSRPHIAPYTLEELKGVERFASERGVYLVPEIDLPGHSGRLIADAHDLFGIPGNGSTVNIASRRTVSALTDLLNEVMDVFKSTPYIHLGADEVGLGGLDETADYRQAQSEFGIKSVHDLYCKFVSDMVSVVKKRGKRAIVWEEAFNPDGPYPLAKDALVMVWSQGHNPNDVVKRGYEVVNATWTPLYIVRDNKRSVEFTFPWNPTLFGREGSTEYTPLTSSLLLQGAQLCSWEDSEAIEIQSLRERLALVAERLWNPKAGGTLAEFKSRLAHTDGVVDRLVHPIALKVEGTFVRDENTFTSPIRVTLTPRRPGGSKIRYTLDNNLPESTTGDTNSKSMKTWLPYTGPITVTKTAHLRAGLFDAEGKQQGYLVGAWFRGEIPVNPNLATNRPVTVGPSPDRTDAWAARVAVDGQFNDAGKHWASEGAAPQWLQVDLGKPTPINFINVITYWDGNRYYQWNAETSLDGKAWTQVLDFSKNTKPATSEGYSGKFALTTARYVRINMLKNSANPYVHIVELIVDRLK